MRIIVSLIDWDCDDESCLKELPTQCVIEEPLSLVWELAEDINGDAANLAEYLTDKYGYCVRGLVAELEGVSNT